MHLPIFVRNIQDLTPRAALSRHIPSCFPAPAPAESLTANTGCRSRQNLSAGFRHFLQLPGPLWGKNLWLPQCHNQLLVDFFIFLLDLVFMSRYNWHCVRAGRPKSALVGPTKPLAPVFRQERSCLCQIHVPVQAIKKVKIGEVLRFYGREEKGQRAGAIPAPCGGHGK